MFKILLAVIIILTCSKLLIKASGIKNDKQTTSRILFSRCNELYVIDLNKKKETKLYSHAPKNGKYWLTHIAQMQWINGGTHILFSVEELEFEGGEESTFKYYIIDSNGKYLKHISDADGYEKSYNEQRRELSSSRRGEVLEFNGKQFVRKESKTRHTFQNGNAPIFSNREDRYVLKNINDGSLKMDKNNKVIYKVENRSREYINRVKWNDNDNMIAFNVESKRVINRNKNRDGKVVEKLTPSGGKICVYSITNDKLKCSEYFNNVDGIAHEPYWSPDGKIVLFVFNPENGLHKLIRYNVRTNAIDILAEGAYGKPLFLDNNKIALMIIDHSKYNANNPGPDFWAKTGCDLFKSTDSIYRINLFDLNTKKLTYITYGKW
jgi:hypothetical protein